MAAMLTHEFGNILVGIGGYADLLLRNAEGTEREMDLRAIAALAERGVHLVRQFKSFARQRTVVPRALDLRTVLKGASRMLRKVASDDVTVSMDLGQRVSAVCADESQLQEALLDIVLSANETMSAGGSLSIAARDVSVSGDNATTLGGVRAGDYVLMSVVEQCPGLCPEPREGMLSELVSELNPTDTQGLGLALASVQGIVEQHGGFVRVRCVPPDRREILLHLPAA